MTVTRYNKNDFAYEWLRGLWQGPPDGRGW
jgi:hypothetical protein